HICALKVDIRNASELRKTTEGELLCRVDKTYPRVSQTYTRCFAFTNRILNEFMHTFKNKQKCIMPKKKISWVIHFYIQKKRSARFSVGEFKQKINIIT